MKDLPFKLPDEKVLSLPSGGDCPSQKVHSMVAPVECVTGAGNSGVALAAALAVALGKRIAMKQAGDE